MVGVQPQPRSVEGGYTDRSPALNAANVSPDDSTDLTNYSRSLFIGGAGTLKVTMVGGQTLVLTGVVAGSILPMQVKRVWSTSTTCTNMVAFW